MQRPRSRQSALRRRELLGPAAAASDLDCLLGECADAKLVRRTARDAAARADASLREASSLEHFVTAESTLKGRESALRDLDRLAQRAAENTRSLEAAREDIPRRLVTAETALAEAAEA